MTEQNIQIKDLSGNLLYPKTKASIVINNANKNLGGVEENAQVNKIETVKVNGTALTITNKEVNIPITYPEYTVVKQATAETGFSATYYVSKDGTQVGSKINIPKDMVVSSGSVKTVTTKDNPEQGYNVGDKYIDLVLANATNSHIYILVSDLVDTYTAGTAITITNNQISVNTTTLANTFAQKSNTYTKTEIDNLLSTINSAIETKATYTTTLGGYGITDALTYEVLT